MAWIIGENSIFVETAKACLMTELLPVSVCIESCVGAHVHKSCIESYVGADGNMQIMYQSVCLAKPHAQPRTTSGRASDLQPLFGSRSYPATNPCYIHTISILIIRPTSTATCPATTCLSCSLQARLPAWPPPADGTKHLAQRLRAPCGTGVR